MTIFGIFNELLSIQNVSSLRLQCCWLWTKIIYFSLKNWAPLCRLGINGAQQLICRCQPLLALKVRVTKTHIFPWFRFNFIKMSFKKAEERSKNWSNDFCSGIRLTISVELDVKVMKKFFLILMNIHFLAQNLWFFATFWDLDSFGCILTCEWPVVIRILTF